MYCTCLVSGKDAQRCKVNAVFVWCASGWVCELARLASWYVQRAQSKDIKLLNTEIPTLFMPNSCWNQKYGIPFYYFLIIFSGMLIQILRHSLIGKLRGFLSCSLHSAEACKAKMTTVLISFFMSFASNYRSFLHLNEFKMCENAYKSISCHHLMESSQNPLELSDVSTW